jgi:hypothetical protein
VEGPTCKIKEAWGGGLFNFYAPVDRYMTGLTRRPVGSGPSAPDPTAARARKRQGGGARWRRSPTTAKTTLRPRKHVGKMPTRRWGFCELKHVLARVSKAAVAAWRRRGRTVAGRRAAARCAAR